VKLELVNTVAIVCRATLVTGPLQLPSTSLCVPFKRVYKEAIASEHLDASYTES